MSATAELDAGARRSVQVWDLPLRLFHWLLALSIAAAYVTSRLGGGFAAWHGRIGAFILGLLVFRVVWGFIGTTHARFGDFVPTPAALRAYFKGEWQGAGHTPLGALAVFALLFTLSVQVGTGLFASDEIAFEGPLHGLVAKSTSDALAAAHELSFNVLLALTALHVAAIVAYALIKRTDLVRPMLIGRKDLPEAHPSSSAAPERFIVAACISIAIVWLVFGQRAEDAASALEPATAPAPW